MQSDTAGQWQAAFWQVARKHEYSRPLREAALNERLGDWTKVLTTVAVSTCLALGWRAAARGHRLDLLPVSQSEYLGLDVMAFRQDQRRWEFPTTVIELENSRRDDRIAYSLWKVLCVRSELRIVFCYRRHHELATALILQLQTDVVQSIGLETLLNLPGQTVVVIGSRSNAQTFPDGFFKWWSLEHNTARFRLI